MGIWDSRENTDTIAVGKMREQRGREARRKEDERGKIGRAITVMYFYRQPVVRNQVRMKAGVTDSHP